MIANTSHVSVLLEGFSYTVIRSRSDTKLANQPAVRSSLQPAVPKAGHATTQLCNQQIRFLFTKVLVLQRLVGVTRL